jgi:very-short-patch-repair endonuclease
MRGGTAVTGRARRLGRNTTEAERLLWDALRKDQLSRRFRRQHPIPPYVVDFASVEAHLVIEADGGQHDRRGDHDARDKVLLQCGWRTLRFWNNDILENRDGVLETNAAALGPRIAMEPPP